MKLKRYLQFIKESKIEDSTNKTVWSLTEDDINDYFLEMKDAGWDIEINFGFVLIESTYPTYKETESFSELVVSGNKLEPAYRISITKGYRIKDEDVTDNLLFAYDILKDVTGAREIEVLDEDDDKVDINDLLIKGGIFIGKDLDPEEQIEIENIKFFIKTNDEVKLTQKEVADFYDWSYDKSDENGSIYTEISLEDMADYILSKNSEYKDFLIKGTEAMWDYYEQGNYRPDIQSLFQYTLDTENKTLLLKAMIKEIGGLDEVKRHIGDELDDEVYNNIKEMNEEELIDYLLKERFYPTISHLSNDSEVYYEVTETVSDWELSSHVDTNYDEILSNFESIMDDEKLDYKRIRKEVDKKYQTKDKDGNITTHQYKQEETYYELMFDSKWLETLIVDQNYDKDDLDKFGDISDLFHEYCYIASPNKNLNPRISDYGNVDSKALNSDIKAYLKRVLDK